MCQPTLLEGNNMKYEILNKNGEREAIIETIDMEIEDALYAHGYDGYDYNVISS